MTIIWNFIWNFIEQLIAALFVAFFTTVKVVTKALYGNNIKIRWKTRIKKDIYGEQVMIYNIYNRTNDNLTVDDINKMAKLEALLRETLRLFFSW
ncbi:16370_t:CDS:2 [Gigaspora margarita]|uniref:16370_t:CDS:1 n=1 Tax=Gigaspora margarita TaxID=4874 RepID=A0ABM8W271_GIGMA|nr:16370_t:CDS:2 [Gigaspora margarita]